MAQAQPSSKRRWPVILLFGGAAVIGLNILFFVRYDSQSLPSAQFTVSSGYTSYEPGSDGMTVVAELGIKLAPSDVLRQQGLISYGNTADNSLTFTTKKLQDAFSACDGKTYWIGKTLRHEGSPSAYTHPHDATAITFPSFHITFSPPKASCVASSKAYSSQGVATETEAARALWDAVLHSQPL